MIGLFCSTSSLQQKKKERETSDNQLDNVTTWLYNSIVLFSNHRPLLEWLIVSHSFYFISSGSGSHVSHHYDSIPQQQPGPDVTPKTPFSPPTGLLPRLSWFLGLPINVAFYFTIPDVKRQSCQKWVPVSFVVSILWVAVASYVLVWMVTIIGYTFGISDAIMGLTLVAFGSSVSDCTTSVFIARKGKLLLATTVAWQPLFSIIRRHGWLMVMLL